MKQAILIIVMLLCKSLFAQVLWNDLPSDVMMTINDSLKLKMVKEETITFSSTKICIKRDCMEISCVENPEIEKKMRKMVFFLVRNRENPWFFSFYDNGAVDYGSIYFYMPKSKKFYSIDGKEFYDIKHLIQEKYGSMENFQEARRNRNKK